ncbi:MAG: ABC transporter ATP-binding protein [Acidobacteria bacterium]|nr:ABC transporter ATP-binding protein [Acidobacteriota bacterium]
MSEKVVEARNLSKWYGEVVGINDLSFSLSPGVTGLLGPNGAGKSTLLKLIAGLLKPSKGELLVFGEVPWKNHRLKRKIGYCPELDAFWRYLTGFDFLLNIARLSGYSGEEAEKRVLASLKEVDLLSAKDKRIAAYSRGMRQRIKIAQAILHDPELILLDEPLAGMDPIGRKAMIELIKRLGKEGRTLLVSSHILHEIEAMTEEVILIHNGRVIAEGNVHRIRELIDEHPHMVFFTCNDPRKLASLLVKYPDVVNISFSEDGRGVTIQSVKPDEFYRRLPDIVLDNGIEIEGMHSPDDNLEAVFNYLVK